MLSALYIENIAVIEKANIEFSAGLNVLTGETGAGKSIVIDSINAVLGKRSSRTLVRAGADAAYVSATFENLSQLILRKLSSMGYDAEDGTLILSRRLTASGKNTCHINSRPAPVSALLQIGEYLVSIHGQNDNLELMNPSMHIVYIDALADVAAELSAYRSVYRELTDVRRRLAEEATDEQQRLADIDLLTFQIRELEDADITVGEYDALVAERTALQNREKISRHLLLSSRILNGDDEIDGVLRMLDDASSSVIDASSFLPAASGIADRLSSALYELQDISGEIENALYDIDADPMRLDQIEERLDLLYRLRRKYGDTEGEMLSALSAARERLEELLNYTRDRDALEARCRELDVEAHRLADTLSARRRDTVSRFCKDVEREMTFLEMPAVKLTVRHDTTELSPRGTDAIEFLISTNPGEEPKPVSKIASGGELSRMMLAIKTVLSRADFVDTMIFDEIDTGISGSAAGKVGRKLHDLSKTSQVMCVTHQAQIAAFADRHLLIEKSVHNGRTYTDITPLDEDGRIRELSRIVGGEQITDSAVAHARDLLRTSR